MASDQDWNELEVEAIVADYFSMFVKERHVAATIGDGLGYDVHSFTADGRDRFIEVKTTQLGAMTPFYITESEISFSTENHDRYSLYRVYDFAARPSMFSLDGRVDSNCTLRPTQFMALPR